MEKYKVETLTIAGSDCSGGAGIQADLKTFSAIGTYGMSVITAITAQNTKGVLKVENLSVDIIKSQIESIIEDIPPKATKIGMVSEEEIIKELAYLLKKYKLPNIVLDPVMISKSGFSLLNPNAKNALKKYLIPLADIVTPNIPEAEELSEIKIDNIEDMKRAGKIILDLGSNYVLIKGGHLNGEAIDLLLNKDKIEIFKSERLNRKNTHGTGCTLSSAITANLALGKSMPEAVKESKNYITEAIKYSYQIGHGIGPVNHFYKFI